jgi:parallel beta-helix repeat protein
MRVGKTMKKKVIAFFSLLTLIFLILSIGSEAKNHDNYYQNDSVNRSLTDSEPIIILSDIEMISAGFNGSGTLNDPYRIEYLKIRTTEDYGIYIIDISLYFVVQYCDIDSYSTGIHIENTLSGRVNVTHNIVSEIKGGIGIFISHAEQCYVFNNTCVNNYEGIYIEASFTSKLVNNTCTFNTYGIIVVDCLYSLIENNTINYNNENGLGVYSSTFSIITYNELDRNNVGIDFSSDHATVSENSVTRSQWVGISIYISNYSVFTNNFVFDSYYYGMYFSQFGGEAINNIIHHNTFILNGVNYWFGGVPNCADFGYNNTWYEQTTLEGNYWHDWDGEGPHYFNGNFDPYPLTAPDSDSDTLDDLQEIYVYGTNPNKNDTDSDGLLDGDEIFNHTTSPTNSDSDFDGLSDSEEIETYLTNPLDSDSDDDELKDGTEVNTHNSNPLDPDTDNDGMPDGWEANYGLNLTAFDSDGDLDNDNLINIDEFLNGTNPIVNDTDQDGLLDGEEIRDYNTNPLDSDSDDDQLTDAEEVLIHETNPNSPDSDNDGLSDNAEINIQLTDPNDSDTDDDGMPDGWEVTWDLDPHTPDASDDLDGDGLTNLEEYYHNTNPKLEDTDFDGYPDNEEVRSGSDPLNPLDHPLMHYSTKITLISVGGVLGVGAITGLIFMLLRRRVIA